MSQLDKYIIYNNYKSIEHDLITLLRYVDLKESNYQTSSAEIRKLILAACSFIEKTIPYFEDEFKYKFSEKEKRESAVVSLIYKFLKTHNVDLKNCTPIIQGTSFIPWESEEEREPYTFKWGSQYTYKWWKAYNTSKHHKEEENVEFFKSAIESVLALFVITIYLLPNLNKFWFANDIVIIGRNGKSIDYNKSECPKSQLGWNKKAV